jgi:parvulin-like peptidyl-prolyl isomerase
VLRRPLPRGSWRTGPWLIVALLSACLAGCGKNRDLPSVELQTVVATYKGGQITLGEWLHYFRELRHPEELDEHRLDENLYQIDNECVSEKVLADRAREAGLHKDPKMIEQLSKVREESLLNFYSRRNVDEAIVIKRAELKQFYDENQDRFQSPSTYSYYRIFFSNQMRGKEEAEKRAKDCWTQLERGANFNDLVGEYSDTSLEKRDKPNGPFKAGEQPAEIEQVILETPIHRHSPVVELPNGYMIFYPDSKTESVARPYAAVEKQIYKDLFAKKQSALAEDLMRQLSLKYKVTTHKELFDKGDVKAEDTVLEINPGGVVYPWSEFSAFAAGRNAQSRSDREAALELFARRKMLLLHAHQTKFAETEYYRKRIRPLENRILSDFFMQTEVDYQIEPTEDELKDYYRDNSEEFRRPERLEAWHLAKKIRYSMNASEKERVDEEQKILGWLLAIRKRIAEQGESFVTWADRFTDYEDKGYLGWVPVMAMPPEWSSVVARLEEGEISQPIKIKDTYELVLKGGREEGGVIVYESARDQVVKRAKEKKIAVARRVYLEKILADLSVTYNGSAIKDLAVRLLDRSKRPPQYWLDPYQ